MSYEREKLEICYQFHKIGTLFQFGATLGILMLTFFSFQQGRKFQLFLFDSRIR